MSSFGDNGTVTGQAFRVKAVDTTATALPMPVVTRKELEDKDSDINQYHLSGKQRGAMVAFGDSSELNIAIAQGHLPTDSWSTLSNEMPIMPAEQ